MALPAPGGVRRSAKAALRSAPFCSAQAPGSNSASLRCCLSAPLRATSLHSARSLLRCKHGAQQPWRAPLSACFAACHCAIAVQRIAFSARFACSQLQVLQLRSGSTGQAAACCSNTGSSAVSCPLSHAFCPTIRRNLPAHASKKRAFANPQPAQHLLDY